MSGDRIAKFDDGSCENVNVNWLSSPIYRYLSVVVSFFSKVHYTNFLPQLLLSSNVSLDELVYRFVPGITDRS